MASSFSTKLRIAYNVVFAPGFFDAMAGRFAFVPSLVSLPTAAPAESGTTFADLRGALHNHSTYSDGLSDIPTIMDAGAEAGVDFVLLADHNTMEPLRDGWQERYAESSPFLLVGTEVTVNNGRFLLALDVPPEYEPEKEVSAQSGIDAIRAHGGFPLISLPFDMKHPFDDWSVSGYDGLEVLNFSTTARRHINFLSLPIIVYLQKTQGIAAVIRWMATRPDAAIARWDSLTRGGKRQVVGIGSLDAHAQMKMFGRKYPIPTYTDSFRACQTHVLIDVGITGAARIAAVNAALRAGRCYFSYDCLGDPTGFTFAATNIASGAVVPMGERLAAHGGEKVRFAASATKACGEKVLLRLYKDGKPVASSVGGTLEVTVSGDAGAYRIEAFLFAGRVGAFFYGVRPWVYSNPVYVSEISR
ncbi:MAG: hypothetical protein H7Y38_02865 [Armatimonadetes bacterium]|nr:hypothetical protein [Armatimonadota bacterium]